MTFALLNALVFASWQWTTWWLGGGLGLLHALFILTVGMPMLPDLHPRMASKHHDPTPTQQLEPPGFLALNYGRNTAAITLFAHVAYGALLGSFIFGIHVLRGGAYEIRTVLAMAVRTGVWFVIAIATFYMFGPEES